MDTRLRPLALGLGAGVVQFAFPETVGVLIVVVAALAAGWVLPEDPMKAALPFLLPTVLLGAVRFTLDDESAAIA